jgi:hypothetical protein
MILDAQNYFSNDIPVTADAISDVIDLIGNTRFKNDGSGAYPNILKDIGTGQDLYLVIQVGTVSWAAAGTVIFTLESDSTANLATSATVHWTSGSINKSALTAGARVAAVKLPAGSYERYLGVRYNVTTDETQGTIDAFLTTDVNSYTAYSDNMRLAV